MNISVSIDFVQLKNAIAQCNVEEKMELLRLLENETFPNRFKQFLEQVKTDELNLDDITAEVEAVRQKNLIKFSQKNDEIALKNDMKRIEQ